MDINNITTVEREIKAFIRTYNKDVANKITPDEGIYDYDKFVDSLSYVVKTLRRLDKVQKKAAKLIVAKFLVIVPKKKAQKKKAAKCWNLYVSYDLSRNMQSKIDNITKVESTGSGAGFGRRDITYLFSNKKTAIDAKRKLVAKFHNNIKCDISPAVLPRNFE